MKIALIIAVFISSGLAFAESPKSTNIANEYKPMYLLSNPDGTGAIYIDGKKLGNVSGINKSLLKEADPDPTPAPTPTPTPPEGPKSPPCNADGCGGGGPKPTPTPCYGIFCGPKNKFGSAKLILVPQETNTKFDDSLDEKAKQLFDSNLPAK